MSRVTTITYNPECFKLNLKNARGRLVVIVMPMLNIYVFDIACRGSKVMCRDAKAECDSVIFSNPLVGLIYYLCEWMVHR